MTNSGEAHSSVWSAIGWDGDKSLTSARLHFDRMRRHSRRLGIDFPDDFSEQVSSLLGAVSVPEDRNDDPSQDPYLMVIRLTSEEWFLQRGREQEMALKAAYLEYQLAHRLGKAISEAPSTEITDHTKKLD